MEMDFNDDQDQQNQHSTTNDSQVKVDVDPNMTTADKTADTATDVKSLKQFLSEKDSELQLHIKLQEREDSARN